MIDLKDVTKYYGTLSIGLYHVNLTINTGEVVGILGQNGSGKTTFIKSIMGLCELSGGHILIDNKPSTEQYHQLAFITEEGSYFPNMTPYEYGQFLADFFPLFDIKKYEKLLYSFELEPYEKIKTFSKGQKSKLEIAAGFSKGAKYILMDEPFLGKDVFTRNDFLKLMAASLKADETILISTHAIQEIENFIDRAVILRYGRVEADCYIDDLREGGSNLMQLMMEVTGYEEDKFKQFIPT